MPPSPRRSPGKPPRIVVLRAQQLRSMYPSSSITPPRAILHCFFLQAEDGIRDLYVTGVQTCALPIFGTELDLRLFGYRDTTPLANGQVDDAPYGGGAGMVLRVDVVAAALDAAYGGVPEHRVIALTPQGRQLTQDVVEELARERSITLLSARYEGFDERVVRQLASDAISIGPYVLSNGDLPAMV